MSGYDFNRDGKVNGTDYYLYEEVFSDDKSGNNSTSYGGSSSYSSSSDGLRWVKYIIAAAYLTPWLKGNLGFGFISMVLGLICAWILLKPVLEWFGS